jgi:hypothetical protein
MELRDRQYCSSTPAVSAALVERIGTREDAPVLHHGSGKGDGGNGRTYDALRCSGSKQSEHNNDQEDQAQSATGIVAPSAAVRPSGKGGHQ